MDENAVAAICAVPPELQGGDAEKFFDLIVEMYGNGDGTVSLDELAPQVGQREPGLANPVTQFSENLRQQGLDGRWPDIARMLASEGGSGAGLAALRDQYAAGAAGAGAAPAQDWESFRDQNADFWAGWNGADWPTWRAAFTERVPAELAEESERQLGYLDGLQPAGQMTYIRDTLGFAINAEALAYYQSAEASPSEASPSEVSTAEAAPAQDWASFQAGNADFWAGWNGTDWVAWRAAFAERVPAELAEESERQLGYLDGLDPAGQLAYLRDTLAFAINEEALAYYQSTEPSAGSAAAPEQAAENAPPQEPQEPEAGAPAQPEADVDVDPELVGEAADALAAALQKAGIDAADISEEDLAQLLEEVS